MGSQSSQFHKPENYLPPGVVPVRPLPKAMVESPVCSTTTVYPEFVTSLPLRSLLFLVVGSRNELLQEPCNRVSPPPRVPPSNPPSLSSMSNFKQTLHRSLPCLTPSSDLQLPPPPATSRPWPRGSTRRGCCLAPQQRSFPLPFSPALPQLLLFFSLRSCRPRALHKLSSIFPASATKILLQETFV